PQVEGIIKQRLFTEGSLVQAGEVLYQIDPAPYQAALKQAEANLAKAQASANLAGTKAKRYADLLQKKTVSQQDYDDAQASHEEAKADVLAAEAASTAQLLTSTTPKSRRPSVVKLVAPV
ncbi:MAG: biotin/lipoyl-binding protein, partial [Shewanella xiamenensis]|nr:biotin/lipoyl-binding protein [Shewanella xiamenensis]